MVAESASIGDAQTASQAWFDAATVEPLGNGHIHQTFLITNMGEATARYVLQRINPHVYRDIDLLQNQTLGLLRQLTVSSGFVERYQVPELVLTKAGGSVAVTGHQNSDLVWRLWRYIDNSLVCDPPTNREQIWQAASAFGAYQRALSELTADHFADTIPGFLDMPNYLAHFDEVLAAAIPAEREQAAEWINVVKVNRQWPIELQQRNGLIHGDCKIDNLLFDQSGEHVLAVIDLDNTMRGHWAWDFGDLVRSVTFSRGGFDALDYRACAEGFIAGRGSEILEAKPLVEAPAYLAFMLGLRFLTDHIAGDRYFLVPEHGENLRRAAQQFNLYQQFKSHRPVMADVVAQLF